MNIDIGPSPHTESFRKVRNTLGTFVKERLQSFLVELKVEGLIDFEPHVECAIPNTMPAGTKRESAAFLRGCNLEEEIRPLVSLGELTFEWQIGSSPQITDRGSFILNGTERCIIAQFARSPGVFFSNLERKVQRFKEKWQIRYALGELKAEKGFSFEIRRAIEPNREAPRIIFSRGESIHLWPFCHAIGVLDGGHEQVDVKGETASFVSLLEEAERHFVNSKIELATAYSGIARALDLGGWITKERLGNGAHDTEKIRQKIQEQFFTNQVGTLGRAQINRKMVRVDPEYSESSSTLTRSDVVGILKLFARFCDGKYAEDDPWSLSNLRVRLVGERFQYALEYWFYQLEQRARRALDGMDKAVKPGQFAEILQRANLGESGFTLFTRIVRRELFQSQLSQLIYREQNNYLAAAALTRRITFNGPGGISIGHERKPRDFHWSHYGRLCPLDTPQSDDVGVTLSLTASARVNDLGILEARCREIYHGDGGPKIGDEDVFVSPWLEDDVERGWIAFPDQSEALLSGKDVYAHKGSKVLEKVQVDKLSYIHADDSDLYSLAANLIPYRAHNDPVRGVMTCSFLRQALPLVDAIPPRIQTGFESHIPAALPYSYGQALDGSLAYGKELCVGYMPWQGWNFEDAIVIAHSAASALTSIHDYSLPAVRLLRTQGDQKLAIAMRKDEVASIPDIDIDRFDVLGIIKKGQEVCPGDALIFEPGSRLGEFTLHSSGEHSGFVHKVEIIDENKSGSYVRLVLRKLSRAEVGDKLANRYGHKGVISRIVPDCELPYFLLPKCEEDIDQCPCNENRPHRHLQILLNPLGVISRMNIGQLYETVAARSVELQDMLEKVPCWIPSTVGQPFALQGVVLVGEQYFMKLDHNAGDKIHGRSRVAGGYNQFVEQPLKGKRLQGGQRMGEMEIWALMAHDANALMQEVLTVKSDNPRERLALFRFLLDDKCPAPVPALPEALKTWAACSYGLGLNMALVDGEGKLRDPLLEMVSPEDVRALKLSLLDHQVFLKGKNSKGEIKKALSSGRGTDFRYHPEGLESEQIFGPVKSFHCACGKYPSLGARHRAPRACEKCDVPIVSVSHRRQRMGHIKLVLPVPNPYVLLSSVQTYLGMSCRSFLEDKPSFVFEKYYESDDSGKGAWERVAEFFRVAVTVSEPFRRALERELDDSVTSGMAIANDPEGGGPEEWRAAPGKLHQEMLTQTGGYDSRRFVEEAMQRYPGVKQALRGVSALMNTVLEDSGICAIDFLADMLCAQQNMRALSLDILPVIPPPLRRRFMVGGQYRPHDLTTLYKAVLKANVDLGEVAADRNAEDSQKRVRYRERRIKLQRAVGQLMCNQMLRPRDRARDWYATGRPVRQSLSSYLEGKQGLLTGNLLGKRTDYSGRAVIVPDPRLPLDSCRLPLAMAVRIYHPQLFASLRKKGVDTPEIEIDQALTGYTEALNLVKDTLQQIAKKHPILLNRQPTLHRLGMLAFNVELVDNNVIAINPMVTKGFNADFDGDQMAVFLPVMPEAKIEAQGMLPSLHLWHPANGDFVLSLDQDIALGAYLEGKGAKRDVAEYFARQSDVTPSIDEIEQFATQAFDSATRSGTSFSVGDLKQLAQESRACDINADDSEKIGHVVRGKDDKDVFKRIIISGARGNWETMNYLVGRIHSNRVDSNLTLGLSVGEQLYQSFSGRRNLVDTKLGTAEGGALTKELVSRAHGVWITQEDCETQQGVPVKVEESIWLTLSRVPLGQAQRIVNLHLGDGKVTAMMWEDKNVERINESAPDESEEEFEIKCEAWNKKVLRSLHELPNRRPPRLLAIQFVRKLGKNENERHELLFRRLYGRVLANHDSEDLAGGDCLDSEKARKLAQSLVDADAGVVQVRSPITCAVKGGGVCRACYGMEWSRGRNTNHWDSGQLAQKATRIGVIAAQAIGEPGTQMALRKKHAAGGAVSNEVTLTDVEAVRDLFKLLGKAEFAIDLRDSLDYIYRANDIHIASVHFETLIGAFPSEGWLADAADSSSIKKFHAILCEAAIDAREDRLPGLKEHVVIGSRLPE